MKGNQIKIGAVLSYITIAFSNLVALLYTPIMLRYMGQSEYGLYSLIASIIGYLSILDFGFGNAIIVYTAKYRALDKKEDEKKLHSMFFVVYLIIGILTAIIGIIVYFNVNNLFGSTMNLIELEKAKQLMTILTINLAFTFPLSIFGSIITAYEKFIFVKIINIIRVILNPLIMLPLLSLGYRSITMAIVTTIFNFAVLIINLIYCTKKLKIKIIFGFFDYKLFKEVFSYSFYIFLGIIVDKVNWSVDHFIIGATAGTIAVAIYAVASQVNMIYMSFSTAISGVLLPRMSKMVANNSTDDEISDEFIKTGRLQFLILALILTGFTIFGQAFIKLWAGSEYDNAYYIALILMVPLTIPVIQNIGINVLQAKNKVKFRSIIYILIAIINICISIPLSKKFGGIGAALGTSIALILGNIIIMNIYYYKKINLNIPKFWREIISISLPIIILFVGTLFIYNNLYMLPKAKLFIGVPLYTFFYCIVAYKFAMNKYEKNILANIFKKIKRKNQF